MRKLGWIVVAAVASVSFSNAQTCPEANYDACTGNNYSIVETEPIVNTPHNEMEAAHWTGMKRHHAASRVHHHRTHRHYRKHRYHCSCR